MGRITSNVGLITGIPITDTVDQLLQVAGAPRDLLLARNQGLQSQQVAVNTLATRLLSLQFDLGKLGVSDPFQAKSVTSQDESLVTATLASEGNPPVGNFPIRTVQTASSQQLISQRFEDLDDIQSTGSLTFGFGGFVDKGISLDELNDGAGVSRGQIRITDLDDNTAIIDLTAVRTVDDVVEAINNDTSTNIVASVEGDSFKLTDDIGSGGTLSVQEVGTGTTAADLGLDGISTSSSEATGSDVYGLYSGIKLSRLNDGNGVRITDDLTDIDDLSFTLTDETTAGVDLSGATTLADVVDAINNDDDLTGKVTAAISADGQRLEITDSTSGAGTFAISNGVLGSAADDLGLTETSSGGVITGGRLVAGLRDTLLSSLNGGAGIGELGGVGIIDRSNSGTDVVDLSSAETLEDVIDLFNASTQQIEARFNSSRNGIEIEDVSGQSGTFVIANDDATNSADAFGITISDSVSSVNGGTLNRQTISEATLLSSLGITASDITITDSNGEETPIDLNASGAEAETVGDVIDAINASTAGVQASINETGDGILITDTALGSQTLGISDLNGTLAEKLNLTRASTTIDINGTDTQVIDGTNSYSIDLTDVSGTPESVALSSVNNGAGIDYSDIKITDSNGGITVLDLNGSDSGITTIGQIVDAINARGSNPNGAQVTASINDSQTGILLTDDSGGDLVVEDINGSAAADLKILSTDTTGSTIDGIGLFSSQSISQGALDSVADRINDLDSGVTASTFFDGVGYRLSLVVDETGSANEILVDVGDSGFAFEQTSSAEDALIVLGEEAVPGSGILISSSDNDFNEVIEGVNLTVLGASSQSVTVSVEKTDSDLVSAVGEFVDSYNSIRSELDQLTVFDEVELTTGLLFGTNEALRVDTELSRLVTDRYFGVGGFESLAEVGISIDDQGQLSVDETKLQEAFADDPSSLERLFTDDSSGVVAKFNAAVEQLAGADNGLLTNRNDALQNTIDTNSQRIEDLNASLERQRERLLLEFTQLETLIAGLQQNLSALAALQPVAPLTVSSGQ